MNFDFYYLYDRLPVILNALDITLGMSIVAVLLSLGIGIVLALIKVFQLKGLTQLADFYISFFRGTPLLVQLFLLYYGLPQLVPAADMSGFAAAVIGLGLHFAAYMAESIRAAILSVENAQREAALSIGMTELQAMRRIILPQATRIATPPLMNNFIDLLKSTSLAFTLGVADIMAKAKLEAASSFKYFESFVLVALVYWLIVVLLTRCQQALENHLNKAY
ncbi:amino acid ABC transporter permease [Endozoicomonas sp. SM1973]|uniref:Amino acid ABC transporter permease n=1 Tax=Spartinivicinus marinus TaxID=2994442 RepID=A0A853I394_9GAMM|nr:amino acid ABC transporter permease [Spartinivicinus marinus]MCX4025241.1 amino acid ABC transporter permease [Spartinivicinus marinus]NYZ65962.1 amino acid ABC transporter permease [Spartinivicinus marinus]